MFVLNVLRMFFFRLLFVVNGKRIVYPEDRVLHTTPNLKLSSILMDLVFGLGFLFVYIFTCSWYVERVCMPVCLCICVCAVNELII